MAKPDPERKSGPWRAQDAVICSGATDPQWAEALIRAGAGEFYCGVNMPQIADSVGTRGISRRAGRRNNLTDMGDLSELARICADHGAPVSLALNVSYGRSQFDAVFRVAEAALSMGVTRFILKDMGLAAALGARFPEAGFTASSLLGAAVPSAARLLREMGFSRIILPRHIALGAIPDMAALNLETELLFYRERCFFDDGNCNFHHRVADPFTAFFKTITGGAAAQRAMGLLPVPLYFALQEMTAPVLPDPFGCRQRFRPNSNDPQAPVIAAAMARIRQHRFKSTCAACLLPTALAAGCRHFKIMNRVLAPAAQVAAVRFAARVIQALSAHPDPADAAAFQKECRRIYRQTHALPNCKGACYYPRYTGRRAESSPLGATHRVSSPLRRGDHKEAESRRNRSAGCRAGFGVAASADVRRFVGIDWRVGIPSWLDGEADCEGVWIGSETCFWDLPSPQWLARIASEILGSGWKASLLLPAFTSVAEEKIRRLAAVMMRFSPDAVEVIVNDINGMALMREMGVAFSLGRVTLDMEVDPRLRFSGPDRGWGRVGVNRDALALWRRWGARRIYASPAPRALSALMAATAAPEGVELKLGVAGPGVYISQTPNCPFAPPVDGRGDRPCRGPCAAVRPARVSGSQCIPYDFYGNGLYDGRPAILTDVLRQMEAPRSGAAPSGWRLAHWPPPMKPADLWWRQ